MAKMVGTWEWKDDEEWREPPPLVAVDTAIIHSDGSGTNSIRKMR
jgi:hypothetical protein